MEDIELTDVLRRGLKALGFLFQIRLAASFGVAAIMSLMLQGVNRAWGPVPFLEPFVEHDRLFLLAATLLISFGSTLWKPLLLSDHTTQLLNTIENVLDRGNFDKSTRILMWRRIADKAIQELDLSREWTPESAQRAAEEAVLEQKEAPEEPPAQGEVRQ
jgi:hypothetical protein